MRTLFLQFFLLFSGVNPVNSIYNIHITTIDGKEKPMQDFAGEKILIVVIPATRTSSDSVFLRRIDTLSRNYLQQIAIIGVPSIEDGYDSTDLGALRNYYDSIFGNRITVTLGMYTKKTSGNKQHELFAWLTDVEANRHFNYDASGIGQKFFVSVQGELYGVSEPEEEISSKLIERMIQYQ